MNQTNIPAPTREEFRLVFGIARIAARDELTLASINRVAAYQEVLWAQVDRVIAERQQQVPPQTPPISAVEAHGVDSPEAEAMRQKRRAMREAVLGSGVDESLEDLKEEQSTEDT